jgi:hypothetical protein
LRGIRWNSSFAQTRESLGGGIVGREPGDEPLLVDFIGEEYSTHSPTG